MLHDFVLMYTSGVGLYCTRWLIQEKTPTRSKTLLSLFRFRIVNDARRGGEGSRQLLKKDAIEELLGFVSSSYRVLSE